jgi:hypothetical protein
MEIRIEEGKGKQIDGKFLHSICVLFHVTHAFDNLLHFSDVRRYCLPMELHSLLLSCGFFVFAGVANSAAAPAAAMTKVDRDNIFLLFRAVRWFLLILSSPGRFTIFYVSSSSAKQLFKSK